ncbi:MAG: HPr family phosphocarrier protein [Thermoflexales bacterium]|nr:HPr family phosphocarrier protein [Thermoflexales bacterium]
MSHTAQTTLTIHHEAGLHARPAARFVKLAGTFPCTITLRNLNKDAKAVNAKSMVSVLTQGVNQGTRIELVATGEQAAEAIAALTKLIESNFE